MMELLIKNGIVYDPLNKVDGEAKDIAVKDGKVVDNVNESNATMIDASNKMVMPGGVDLHSHIAGAKVNAARMLRPEDHYRDYECKTKVKRSGTGFSIPSTFTTGYRYATMGYTTVFEAASPPLKTMHTHDELNDIPIIDKACYLMMGNNWLVMDYIRDNNIKDCAAYTAWLMNRLKGFAIKIVDPGCVEAWKWGSSADRLDDQVPYFNITPREILRGLCKVNKLLKLPHPIHVHANALGKPGNYRTTLKTMDSVSDLADGDTPTIHCTHVQFNGYAGVDWASIASAAEEIANYVNKHKHVSIDMGQIIFTDTTTMTGDGPFEYQLHLLTKNKWINNDVEAEVGSGIVPIRYKRNNYAHAVMWTIGLELALLIKDPWRVFMTTDNPNGGPFTFYPRVISWLMSKKARSKILKRIPRLSRVRTNLENIDREYSFYEIAIATRAATAKILGLNNKGHLGVGADADIAIYEINPSQINPSEENVKVRRAFARAAYTIKEGNIVVKDGEVVSSLDGRTFWVQPSLPKDLMGSEFKEKFEEYYTINMENYDIPESFLFRSTPIPVESKLG